LKEFGKFKKQKIKASKPQQKPKTKPDFSSKFFVKCCGFFSYSSLSSWSSLSRDFKNKGALYFS